MVEAGGSSWHQSNRGISFYFAIYLFLLFVVIFFSKVLHESKRLSSIIPEAGMIILVGFLAGIVLTMVVQIPDSEEAADDGALVDGVAESLFSFSPTTFFVILLPPIIFNSGYHLRRDLFFRHIIPICLFACVGTSLAAFIFAMFLHSNRFLFSNFDPSFLELLTFGALISATDPVSTLAVFQAKKVDPQLFYLVFGESVINDAVGLVLFEALAHLVEKYNEQPDIPAEVAQFLFDFVTGFIGSMVLGLATGLAAAWFFKVADLRHTPLLELCLYVTMMYSPFVLAEIARLSGIVTVLFAGITARRYIEPNLSTDTAHHAATIFRLIAHLTETIIFLDLGLSIFGLSFVGNVHFGFIGLSLLGCFLSRACNIYPLTFIYNMFQRGGKPKSPEDISAKIALDVNVQEGEEPVKIIDDRKIPWNTAHMIWFSGLRGAVSYALVRTFPSTGNETAFTVTTKVIVLVTTFVLGGTTEMMLQNLQIPVGVDEVQYMKSLDRRYFLQGGLHRFEAYTLRRWVIRDFKKTPSANSEETDTEDSLYHEHVEMTELDHNETVQKESKFNSVYDFGNY